VTLAIAIAIALLIFVWGMFGAMYVLCLDIFGRRYDYDKDYPLSALQLVLCGPFVWWMEYRKRRR
jgi:ABC-type Fe3+-siderophore transport system permease subunit